VLEDITVLKSLKKLYLLKKKRGYTVGVLERMGETKVGLENLKGRGIKQRLKEYSEMELKEPGSENVEWIHLGQDRVQSLL
jgi:hypothetical protein